MEMTEIMDEVSRRAERGDAQSLVELCSPEMRFTQNTGLAGGVEALVAMVEGLTAMGIQVSYRDVRRIVGPDSVTEQHVVTLTRADGTTASTDVCVVARFGDDGLIAEVDEYLDSAAFAAVLS